MNADGSNQAVLDASGVFDHEPDWSSTNKIVFVSNRSGNDELYVLDMNGPGQALPITTTSEDELDPSYSPDGSRIAYTVDVGYGSTRIYMKNSDGSGTVALTTGDGKDGDPSWSPDGTRIVFTRNGEVWLMNADGNGKVRLTTNNEGNDADPVYSPDGTRIAFTRGPEGNRMIYIVPVANPANVVPLPLTPYGTNAKLDWIQKP
jgi:Tol biopolymer transport system component